KTPTKSLQPMELGGDHQLGPMGQQVLHVRGDSETDLETLFNTVMNPQGGALPWRYRKLPPSFFREPDSGSHSRQSSADSTSPCGIVPQHSRSHSSPANLQQIQGGLGGFGPLQLSCSELQQATLAVAEPPLPPGWEVATTPSGQRYYI
uniref:WW domain-containing protein n=1 Tax=Petromyzon marinus TaxID=7757 RepID=S4RVF5_PETMA